MKITNNSDNTLILKELGTRVKDIRVARNITQSEFSRLSGISQRTLTRLENGENVKLDILLNAVRALGFTENFNLLLAEQSLKPTQIFDGQTEKRKRASSKSKKIKEIKWGDTK